MRIKLPLMPHGRRRSFPFVIAIGVGLVIASSRLYALEAGRDHAIAIAKRYGPVEIYMDKVDRILLSNRKAVDEVLPLLKDIPDLKHLSISGVNLNDDDIRRISELAQLRGLTLSTCEIDDADFRVLSKLNGLT
jgi:hypothetical protein